MSKEGGCFLFFVLTICLGMMAFAAEGKQVGQLSTIENTKYLKRTPSAALNIKAKVSTTWCIVKPSTPQDQLDKIIQHVCNEGGMNCSVIQPGGSCYNPTNQVSNAAVVMNIYYSVYGNCNFSGSGLIVDKDPSVGNCIMSQPMGIGEANTGPKPPGFSKAVGLVFLLLLAFAICAYLAHGRGLL